MWTALRGIDLIVGNFYDIEVSQPGFNINCLIEFSKISSTDKIEHTKGKIYKRDGEKVDINLLEGPLCHINEVKSIKIAPTDDVFKYFFNELTTKNNQPMFQKDQYIVSLKSGDGFTENHIYKQRENCWYLRPYLDSRGNDSNGWAAIDFSDKFSFRFPSTEEVAMYDLNKGPCDVTIKSSEKLTDTEENKWVKCTDQQEWDFVSKRLGRTSTVAYRVFGDCIKLSHPNASSYINEETWRPSNNILYSFEEWCETTHIDYNYDVMKEIQAICKEKYPIGAVVSGLGSYADHVIEPEGVLYEIRGSSICSSSGAGFLFNNGKWAKLKSLTNPCKSVKKGPSDIYQIQEECKKRYPIGTKYKCAKNKNEYVLESTHSNYEVIDKVAIDAGYRLGWLYYEGNYAEIISTPVTHVDNVFHPLSPSLCCPTEKVEEISLVNLVEEEAIFKPVTIIEEAPLSLINFLD